MPDFKEIRLYKITENPYIILKKSVAQIKESLVKYLIGIVAIYLILNWVPELISLSNTYSVMDFMVDRGMVDKEVASQLPEMPSLLVYVYALLFNGVLNLGESLYVLTFIRNKKVEYVAIAESFTFYSKALLLFIIRTIFVAIGSMLFIFPGIIAAINLSQTYYILADNPEKPITHIIAESNYRMLGNRMAFVRLIFAFLPYILIAYIPTIAVAFFLKINTTTLSGMLIYLLAEVPLYCAMGMLEVGKGVFYELSLTGGFENFKYKGQDIFRENIKD